MPRGVEKVITVLVWVLMALGGCLMLAIGLSPGADTGFAVAGLLLLAVTGVIVRASWRTAHELRLEGDRLSWQGLFSGGQTSLADLRRIGRPFLNGPYVRFSFGNGSDFLVLPAQGLLEFVERLAALRPGLDVDLGLRVRFYASLVSGSFEETDGDQPGLSPSRPPG